MTARFSRGNDDDYAPSFRKLGTSDQRRHGHAGPFARLHEKAAQPSRECQGRSAVRVLEPGPGSVIRDPVCPRCRPGMLASRGRADRDPPPLSGPGRWPGLAAFPFPGRRAGPGSIPRARQTPRQGNTPRQSGRQDPVRFMAGPSADHAADGSNTRTSKGPGSSTIRPTPPNCRCTWPSFGRASEAGQSAIGCRCDMYLHGRFRRTYCRCSSRNAKARCSCSPPVFCTSTASLPNSRFDVVKRQKICVRRQDCRLDHGVLGTIEAEIVHCS